MLTDYSNDVVAAHVETVVMTKVVIVQALETMTASTGPWTVAQRERRATARRSRCAIR